MGGIYGGCGCKVVYRFPNITYPYIYAPLVSTLFCNSIPTFSFKKNVLSFLFMLFLCNFIIKNYC